MNFRNPLSFLFVVAVWYLIWLACQHFGITQQSPAFAPIAILAMAFGIAVSVWDGRRFGPNAARRPKGSPIVVTGSFNGPPPIWFGGAFVLFGACALGAAATARFSGSPNTAVLGRLLLAGIGALFGGAGAWVIRIRGQMLKTRPLAAIGAQLGTDCGNLEAIAAERGIRPRFVVNGVPYFYPADFGDGDRLLRSADGVSPEISTLVRPAAAAEGENSQLLRPTDGQP